MALIDRQLPAESPEPDHHALSPCIHEPLHRPDTVQGRGVLLALDGEGLRIGRVSSNCDACLGLPADAVLGRPLAAVLGDELAVSVRRAVDRWREDRRQPVHFRWIANRSEAAGHRGFACYIHESSAAVVLELEPDTDDSEDDAVWLSDVLARFSAVRGESDLTTKLSVAATLLREITGYDRVLIYRFDGDRHGEVIAEARREDLTPCLAQHCPASDLPAQALRSVPADTVRIIDDIDADASALLPTPTAPGDETLDLSFCVLRGVAPGHCADLRERGVRATMTARLVHEGEPWGLIVCHHGTPRRPSQRLRALMGWLAADLATQAALCEAHDRHRYAVRLKRSREAIMDAMRDGTRLATLIGGAGLDDLLDAVGADGVALVQDGSVVAGGSTPRPWQVLSIAAQVGAQRQHDKQRPPTRSVFVTDCLSEHLDWTAALADVAAGVVMGPLTSDAGMVLLWFRGAQLRSAARGVAADGATGVDADERIGPPPSFAAPTKIGKRRSPPWSAEEITSARALATLIDIEQRRVAEQAVRDWEAHLQGLLDNSPAVIFIKDLEGRYLMVNRRGEALLGVRNADLVGKTPAEVLPPEAAATFMANDRTLLATLQAQRVEETIDTTEGRRTLLSTQFPLRDGAGEATAICGIAVDITDRLRMEHDLKVTLAKYRALFEHFPLGITVVDDQGNLIETNPASEQILGITIGEHLNRRIDGPQWTILRPNETPMAPSEYASVRALTERVLVRDQEMIVGTSSGDRRWLSVTAAPLEVEGMGAVVVYEDITARKQVEARRRSEAAIHESERRFRLLTDELPLIVWINDSREGTTFYNRAGRAFGGWDSGTDADGAWRHLLHPDDADAYIGAFKVSCRERTPFHATARFRHADGAWRLMESSGHPVFLPDGSYVGNVGTSLDITERNAAEEALRASHRELQRRAEQLGWLTSQLTLAEHRERERLAKVLHDHLQQLLVSALFGIDRAERRLGEAAPEQGVQQALDSVKEVVQDAIDAARSLVADLSPPILHEAGLPQALDWLARTMRENYGLRVDLFVEPDLPPTPDDVRSVLFESVREALFNVVKHAGCGRAQVTVQRVNGNQLCIVVGDRGKGFDLKGLREDRANATGFGLLSMHERLRFLGGACTVQSKPDKGTRVVLTSPLEPAPLPEPESYLPDIVELPPRTADDEPVTEPGDRPLRVLIVDDHAMMRQGLNMLLDDEPGIEITGQAADGVEALEQVERLRPDVVLMDYSMPHMDGLEATRRIHRDWPDIRIIGLSMYHEADRGQAMMDAGAAAYVTKTAGRDALLSAICPGSTADAPD